MCGQKPKPSTLIKVDQYLKMKLQKLLLLLNSIHTLLPTTILGIPVYLHTVRQLATLQLSLLQYYSSHPVAVLKFAVVSDLAIQLLPALLLQYFSL